MRRWIRFVLLSGYMLGPWVAGCAQPARFYVSQPAHTLQSEKTAAVAVWIEDRTLIWMNGVTLRARLIDLEQAGCGHIAKNIGDGFWIDSIMPPRGNVILTPRTATWTCRDDEVPIHWHPGIASNMCELSNADMGPENVRFPFNMMMCGLGIDSVVAYKVKPAPAVARGK